MNKVIDWLTESGKRLFLKSPRYFKVWQHIAILAMLLGFLPDAVETLKITTTPIMDLWVERVLKIAGAILWLNSKLTVANVGTVVRDVPEALPFSEANPVDKRASVAKARKRRK